MSSTVPCDSSPLEARSLSLSQQKKNKHNIFSFNILYGPQNLISYFCCSGSFGSVHNICCCMGSALMLSRKWKDTCVIINMDIMQLPTILLRFAQLSFCKCEALLLSSFITIYILLFFLMLSSLFFVEMISCFLLYNFMLHCSVQLFYKYTYSSYSQWTNWRTYADLLVPFFHLFHRYNLV